MDQIKREFQSPPLVTSRQSLTVTATKTEMMETSSRMETSPRKNIKVETSSEDSPRKQQLKKPAEIKSEARQAQLSEAQSDSSTAATGTQQSPRTSKHRRSTTAQRRARRKSKSAEPETDPSASGTGYIRIPIQRPKADVSYAEARKYLDDPMVAESVEHRHITLGWQHAGHIERTINHLLGVTVGQYRASVGGVCMAIGGVRILKPMFIIDYHNCMHVDVDVHMIVFKVQPGEPLQLDGEKQIRCQCQAITSDYAVLGTAYGNLGMCCNPAPAGVNIGDYFMARLKAVNFKQSLCQIEVQPLSIRRFAD